MKKKKNNKGFSLVELIVVIAIMAVLVGVLAPQFIKYVEKSRASTDLDNCQAIISAVQVGVADEDVTVADDTYTITVTRGSAVTITASGSGSLNDALTNAGITNFVGKSTTYNGQAFTLTVANGTVTVGGSSALATALK